MVLKRVLVGVGALVLTLSGCDIIPQDKPKPPVETHHATVKKRYFIDGFGEFTMACLGKDLMVHYNGKMTMLANHEECR